jgi:hypothetical protein
MARFTEADGATIWEMREAGVPVKRIERAASPAAWAAVSTTDGSVSSRRG